MAQDQRLFLLAQSSKDEVEMRGDRVGERSSDVAIIGLELISATWR